MMNASFIPTGEKGQWKMRRLFDITNASTKDVLWVEEAMFKNVPQRAEVYNFAAP